MIIIIVLAATLLYTDYNSCMDTSLTSIHETYTNKKLEKIYNEQINTSNQNETNISNCNKIKIKTNFEFYNRPRVYSEKNKDHKKKEVASLTFISSNYTTFAWYERIQIPFFQKAKHVPSVSLYKEKEKTIQEIQDNQLHSYIKTNKKGQKTHIFLQYLNTLEQENTIIPIIQKTILYTLALLQKKQRNVRFYIDLESIHNYGQLDIFRIFTQDYCNNFEELFFKKPFPLYFMFKCSGKTITEDSNFFRFIDTMRRINTKQFDKEDLIYLEEKEKKRAHIEGQFKEGYLAINDKNFQLNRIKQEKYEREANKQNLPVNKALKKIKKLQDNQYLLDTDLNLRAFYIYLFCLSINIRNTIKPVNCNQTGLQVFIGRYQCKYILQVLKDIKNRNANKNLYQRSELNWFHDADKIVIISERGYNTDFKNRSETEGVADWETEWLNDYFRLPTTKDFTFTMVDRGIELCKKPSLWFASCLLFYYCFKIFCPQYYASFLNIITIQEYNKSCLYTDSEIAS